MTAELDETNYARLINEWVAKRDAALLREAEAATAPDVSEAERPKRLCDYDPVETTVGDMVMRFGFDYTNFKFFAESITKLTAALRAARKREGEAVEQCKPWLQHQIGCASHSVDTSCVALTFKRCTCGLDAFLAAREKAAGGGV